MLYICSTIITKPVTISFLSKYSVGHLAGSLVSLSQVFCFPVGGLRENFVC